MNVASTKCTNREFFEDDEEDEVKICQQNGKISAPPSPLSKFVCDPSCGVHRQQILSLSGLLQHWQMRLHKAQGPCFSPGPGSGGGPSGHSPGGRPLCISAASPVEAFQVPSTLN